MAHDVFISYSGKDNVVADAIRAALEAIGVRCWIAPRDINPGESWAASILRGIGACRMMVLVFSSHTNDSPQVRREVERAVHRDLPIAPLRIENVMPKDEMEYFLSSSHWIDALTPPIEQHLAAFARRVRALLNAGGKPVDFATDAAPTESAAVSDTDVLLVETIPEGFLSVDEQWEVLGSVLVKPRMAVTATRVLRVFREKARLDRLKTGQPWRRFGRVRGKGLSILINADDLKTYVDATLAAQRSNTPATAARWSVCKVCKLLRPPGAGDRLRTCPICSDRYGPTFETLHALPERVRQCPWQDCGMIWLIAATQAHCAGLKPNTHPVQRLETVGWNG
jgi:hypothetical protein